MQTRVGFIGIGNMGQLMAGRLLKAGFPVTVFDVNSDRVDALRSQGADSVDSPAKMASQLETIMVCLPNPDVVHDVAIGPGGLIEGNRLCTYVDLSTTGPQVIEKIASTLSRKGVATLDSPVSGGIVGARDGTLALMAAGSRDVFDRLKPILRVFGNQLFYLGNKPGLGQVMKLVNNLLSISAWSVTSEGLAIGTKAGLNPGTMLKVLNASSGKNMATEDRFGRYVLSRTFDSGFNMAGIYKDLSLCVDEARQLGVPTYVGDAMKQLWLHAINQGWGDRSHANIAKFYEEQASVKFIRNELDGQY